MSLGLDSPCTFRPSPRIAWWQGETPPNPAQPCSPLSLFPSCEPPGGICNMKFPFGAGKFPVCRFLGNVAGDRVVGETLACVIPVCPQPRVRHLHPILPLWVFHPFLSVGRQQHLRGEGIVKFKGLFLFISVFLWAICVYIPGKWSGVDVQRREDGLSWLHLQTYNINLVGSSSNGKSGSSWGVRNTQGLLHRVIN